MLSLPVQVYIVLGQPVHPYIVMGHLVQVLVFWGILSLYKATEELENVNLHVDYSVFVEYKPPKHTNSRVSVQQK